MLVVLSVCLTAVLSYPARAVKTVQTTQVQLHQPVYPAMIGGMYPGMGYPAMGGLGGYVDPYTLGKLHGQQKGFVAGQQTGYVQGKVQGYHKGAINGIQQGTNNGYVLGKHHGNLKGTLNGFVNGQQNGFHQGKFHGFHNGVHSGFRQGLGAGIGSINRFSNALLGYGGYGHYGGYAGHGYAAGGYAALPSTYSNSYYSRNMMYG